MSTPTIEDITETIFAAKSNAIDLAESCGMHLDSYDDKYFLKLKNVKEALQHGIENDGEVGDEIDFAEIHIVVRLASSILNWYKIEFSGNSKTVWDSNWIVDQ